MDKYSRYTDGKQRLFIVLQRFSKPIVETSTKDSIAEYEGNNYVSKSKTLITKINLVPTTVLLLNVHNESTKEFTVKEFEQLITEGKLTRIQKEK